MTEADREDQIRMNAEIGVLFVGTVGDHDIWKKNNEQGGVSYFGDYGFPDYSPCLWDTTISQTGELEIILEDIKKSKS